MNRMQTVFGLLVVLTTNNFISVNGANVVDTLSGDVNGRFTLFVEAINSSPTLAADVEAADVHIFVPIDSAVGPMLNVILLPMFHVDLENDQADILDDARIAPLVKHHMVSVADGARSPNEVNVGDGDVAINALGGPDLIVSRDVDGALKIFAAPGIDGAADSKATVLEEIVTDNGNVIYVIDTVLLSLPSTAAKPAPGETKPEPEVAALSDEAARFSFFGIFGRRLLHQG